jgi:hypothetical protein
MEAWCFRKRSNIKKCGSLLLDKVIQTEYLNRRVSKCSHKGSLYLFFGVMMVGCWHISRPIFVRRTHPPLLRKEQWLLCPLSRRRFVVYPFCREYFQLFHHRSPLTFVIDDVRMELDRYSLTKLVGEEHVYNSLPDVLEAYRKETKQVETEPGS